MPLLRLFARARYGGRLQWHGLDVFHFDADGRISGKYTYATFRLPLWEAGDRPAPAGTGGSPLPSR